MPTIDDILDGDGELKRQQSQLYQDTFEDGVVRSVLKHCGARVADAARWCRQTLDSSYLRTACLPEIVPDFTQRLVCCKLKIELRRMTSLTYSSLDQSPLGQAVSVNYANQEPTWLVTDLPFFPGPIVVGQREFPLVKPFTGYVVGVKEEELCYLFCHLKHFLHSAYCNDKL